MLRANAIVGQSGGPTAAINATLSGVIRACLDSTDRIGALYGARYGIEGLLNEEIIDLFEQFSDKDQLRRLERTPSSVLGSCRIRLPDACEDDSIYKRIFNIFERYGVRYFFYIGGNDSMDTVSKLNKYSMMNSCNVIIIGIPKTVDNDLMLTDHTPGYGSAAKYVATSVLEILRDCAVYTAKAVTVIEIMGRDAGWLALAAGLPGYINGHGVDLIYLPERAFSKIEFLSSVSSALEAHPNVVIAVSEGIRYADGTYVGDSDNRTDAFGHRYLGGAARALVDIVDRRIGCKTRAIELNLLQRCAAHLQSSTDISESIRIGKAAVKAAIKGEGGRMLAFERSSGRYFSKIKTVNVDDVANRVKNVPNEFINKDGNGITRACAEYLLPLISGEIKNEYKNGLPVYCTIKQRGQYV